MCCFSGKVQEVSGTRLFAREQKAGWQYLVYEMQVAAQEDVAMILPVPTNPKGGENALRFINLEKYPHFFSSIELAFRPPPDPKGVAVALAGPPPLEVQEVGAYEASFVPTLADFDRLDARFKLPPEVWAKLPQYATFGFAVFMLRAGRANYHPMAFLFERAPAVKGLFFPTVHIHDGTVHSRAQFDHTFYCQPGAEPLDLAGWKESTQLAGRYLDRQEAKGVVDVWQHAYRKEMKGEFPNRDIILAAR